ncbi:hypothetical protein MMC10_006874 [Thelotrema lepadinum]|nr:hypothetical protein [Thelotrema lepadinum]
MSPQTRAALKELSQRRKQRQEARQRSTSSDLGLGTSNSSKENNQHLKATNKKREIIHAAKISKRQAARTKLSAITNRKQPAKPRQASPLMKREITRVERILVERRLTKPHVLHPMFSGGLGTFKMSKPQEIDVYKIKVHHKLVPVEKGEEARYARGLTYQEALEEAQRFGRPLLYY